ncbi:MAG: hypothetical protein NTZ79_04640 [Proteobacteria bacterium]|nr:hypothetical protein [Pseudomonadota bacterium]
MVDNDYFSRLTGRPPEWFLRISGIRERRRTTTEAGVNELAIRAVAPIAVRLEAAYLASLFWRCICPGDAETSADGFTLATMLMQGMRSSARLCEGLTYRWPRSARRRWAELLQ